MPRQRGTSDSQPVLPDAELEVLACLHELGEADATSIRKALHRFRPMTHGSIATLLRRLEGKGLVSHRKGEVGKAYLYSATRSAEVTYRSVLQRMLDRVFRNDPLSLIHSLFSVHPPTPEQAEELRQLVESLHRKAREDE